MKDSDFQLLVMSIKQAGQIKRGEIDSARKTEVRAEEVETQNALPPPSFFQIR